MLFISERKPNRSQIIDFNCLDIKRIRGYTFFKNLFPICLFLLVALLLIVTPSCGRSKNSSGTDRSALPYYVDMESYIDNKKSLPLSFLGKEIEYVALESSPECLLGGISSLWMNDSLIVVSSGTQVYLFDRSGKLIRTIGSNGRGPGEYTYARLSVDPFNNLIRINASRSMLTFDFNGNFLGSFDYAFPSAQGLVLDENSIMFHEYNMSVPSRDQRYSWHILDFEGNEKASFKNNLPRFYTPGLIVPNSPLYIYDGTAHFKEYGIDTLYYFDERVVMPYAIFNAGKYKMEPDIIVTDPETMERIKNKICAYDVIEDDNYLFIEMGVGTSFFGNNAVFDKQTGEFTILTDGAFLNDIDGGVGFWPEVIINDNILIDYVDAFDLLQHLESVGEAPQNINKGKYEKLMELKGSIDDNSNPVIMIIE
jgi:hypothetical protein